MKFTNPWRSVRGRLLLAAIVVEATMLTLLVSNSLRLLFDHMTEQARIHAEQITPVLNAALVAPLAQRDYATIQAILDESRAVRGISYLAVTDRSDKIVAISGWSRQQALPTPDQAFHVFEKQGARYDQASPVVMAGQPLGKLHFGLDLSHIVAAHQQLLSQGMLIAVGELMLSAGLLAVLGYFLTRHLTALTRASQEVATGNFTPAPVAEGDDELGQLGAAFNAMSRAVSERIRELTAARDAQTQLNAEVEQEHARLLSLLSAMDIGVLFVDQGQGIIYENPQFRHIWGLDAAPKLHGHTMAQLPQVAGNTFRDQAVWETLWQQRQDTTEITLMDGRIVTQRCKPVVTRHGQPLGLVYLYEDVTEDRLTAQQLMAAKDAAEAAGRAKAAFLATMSHEIRTPMNGIIGMTDLLAGTTLDAEQQEYLGWAKSSAESLLTVLNDILDFSKIDAGRMELEHVRFAPQALLKEIVGLHQRSAQAKNLQLHWHSAAPLPAQLLGDVVRLRQILNNLLTNSVKFTHEGEIELLIQHVDSSQNAHQETVTLCFSVRDTGVGIAPDKLEQIFSPFAQADSSITRRFGGTGLGLAIAARLAELMGGHIRVESAPNQGSTFHFQAPFKVVNDEAPPAHVG